MADDMAKPAEAAFYDDPVIADLGAKVTQAWTDFRQALAEALPGLPQGYTLNLTLDPHASGVGSVIYGVSVVASEGGQLAAYAVSNAQLPPEHRLSRPAVAQLVALGWSPPGVVAEDDVRFGVRLAAEQASVLAGIVTRTVRDVYGTPHPAFLRYEITSSESPESPEQSPAAVPQLGAARPITGRGADIRLPGRAALEAMPLPAKAVAVIAAMLKTQPENVPLDNDGDIGIRSGSAMVFVRARDDPPLVDVFSPVLTDVTVGESLYRKLSELTHRMPIGRLYCIGATVWASIPVFGRDFQPSHLMLAVQVMTGLADELDDRLHGEYGGRRFFVDGDRMAGEGHGEGGPGAGALGKGDVGEGGLAGGRRAGVTSDPVPGSRTERGDAATAGTAVRNGATNTDDDDHTGMYL